MRRSIALGFGLALGLLGPVAHGGAIGFADPARLSAGDGPASVAAGDFDGDGALDLVAVHRNSDDAWVWLGDGAGGFTFLGSFAVGEFPQGVVAAHLDGDATVDLATTSVEFSDGLVVAWLGNGDGTFALSQELVADDGTRAVEAADLDGDGKLDLIATNATRGNVSAFLGDGEGAFGDELRTPVGTASAFPADLAVVDLDGDGRLDVVTSNAQSTGNELGRLLGDGDGTFGASTAFATTCGRPESVAAGDFDRDGRADVAVACFQSGEVAVLLGDGAGGFAAPVLYDLGPDAGSPYWVLVVDLDRDARQDLVTANNGSLSVLRGRGDGTFEAPLYLESLPGTFFGATAADLDGDGWDDLAFADFGFDQVAVYLNRTGSCGGAGGSGGGGSGAGAECPLEMVAQPGTGGGETPAELTWPPTAAAVGYDVLRGELAALRAAGGDFAVATTACVASQTAATAFVDTDDPAAGGGFWYLLREVAVDGAGSYEVFAGNLAAPRDAGVAASGVDCP